MLASALVSAASSSAWRGAALLPANSSTSSDRGSCTTPQPSVTVAGDHAMSLSDGQTLTLLNTGVVIYPCYAGVWTPAEHQIRSFDSARATSLSRSPVVVEIEMQPRTPALRASARTCSIRSS